MTHIFDIAGILAEAFSEMSGNNTKAIHPIARAQERYGLQIGLPELRELERKIQEGHGIKGRQLGEEYCTMIVECCGKSCRVVWHRTLGIVTTFLPMTGKNPKPKKHRRGKKRTRKVY